MRADRLISLLLILQHSGRKTAQELAEALEVSERTIYRDVIALGTAGVPVYTERGPGGGIRLVESYRTTLTGLSSDEVRALFMFSVPAAMMDLGVSEQFQQAYLKLSASLSGTQQQVEQHIRQRVLIDTEGWAKKSESSKRISLLQQLYQAVWADRVVNLTIKYYFGVQVGHSVEAYSLVASGDDWYLVGRVGGNCQVFDFSQIAKANVLDEQFERETEFDLNSFWREWLRQYSGKSWVYRVKMWVSPQLMEMLEPSSRHNILQQGGLGRDRADWFLVEFEYKNFREALMRILSYGGAARVVTPEALKLTVKDYAEQTAQVYKD